MDGDYSMKTELIMVLGGGISVRGILPSWVEKRLEKAAEIYISSNIPKILVSGKGRDDFPVPEARAMRDYLIFKGIPREDILTEELSRDTIQNIFLSGMIHLRPLNVKSVLIITNNFHLERTKIITDYILGKDIEFVYQGVEDNTIKDDLLQQREKTEQELIKFTEKLFSTFEKGDLNAVHDFIFNPNNKYNKLCYKISEDLSGQMVLY
jgi:vancomycin permeability regulator SanA